MFFISLFIFIFIFFIFSSEGHNNYNVIYIYVDMYKNETISLPTLKPEVPGGRPAARAVREMDLDVGCPNSLFVCLSVLVIPL